MSELTKIENNNYAVEAVKNTQEIQAMFVLANQFPRDEQVVEAAVMRACGDFDLALKAIYDFSKGGKIYGLSVVAMEEIARCYGRLKWGFKILDCNMIKQESTVYCYVLDYQTGSMDERTFIVKHIQVGTTKVVTEQNDIYSVCANYAQRRLRTCLEKMIPYGLRQRALRQLEKTLEHADPDPLQERIKKMVASFFDTFGVTQKQIEAKYQRRIEALTEQQVAQLRIIFGTIRDQQGDIDQFFKPTIVSADVKDVTKDDTKTEASASEEAPEKPKRTRGPNKPKVDATPIGDQEVKNLPPAAENDLPENFEIEENEAAANEHEKAMQASTEAAEAEQESAQIELDFG